MRILFDTSILIASMINTHPQHEFSALWMKKVQKNEISLVVSSHSLLECYAVLTRLPIIPKISPAIAKQLIDTNVSNRAEIIVLSTKDYISLIQECVNLHLSGGIVYDALLFKAALSSHVQHILTLNAKDFKRFSLNDNTFIISPL